MNRSKGTCGAPSKRTIYALWEFQKKKRERKEEDRLFGERMSKKLPKFA